MEAATKNKRGRPQQFDNSLYAICSDKEKRTAQNTFYATGCAITLLKQKPGDFFFTDKGKPRRQGIAEQIGRMNVQDGVPDEQCIEIAETAMQLYKNGYTVKQIENWLRNGRKTGEW